MPYEQKYIKMIPFLVVFFIGHQRVNHVYHVNVFTTSNDPPIIYVALSTCKPRVYHVERSTNTLRCPVHV